MSNCTVKDFYCTVCPSECHLTVTLDETGSVVSVAGNSCPRGERFGRQEATCPMRVLASTVRLEGAHTGEPLIPVRTREAIPLSLQAQAMDAIRKARRDRSRQNGRYRTCKRMRYWSRRGRLLQRPVNSRSSHLACEGPFSPFSSPLAPGACGRARGSMPRRVRFLLLVHPH